MAPTATFSFSTPTRAGVSAAPAHSSSSSFFTNNEASSSSSNIRNNNAMDQDQQTSSMADEDVDICYLEPSAFKRSGRDAWSKSGRTMLAGVNPVGGELAAWITKQVSLD